MHNSDNSKMTMNVNVGERPLPTARIGNLVGERNEDERT